MDLCLGTVQFGLDYGINNQKKPGAEYAISCLDYATQNGIKAIDTATAYGSAEDVVGAFIRKKTINRDSLFISTKMLPNVLDDYDVKDYKRIIRENLIDSLDRLGLDYVDAYLLHSARYAYRDDIIDALYAVQEEGLAVKVGVSIYEPEEAMACFDNKQVSIIQAPYSIFDHRMKKSGVLDSHKCANCEIHTRSAFIQGLIMLKNEEVPPFLKEAEPILQRIEHICHETGLSRIEIAMAYVKKEKNISHLVFGVDSLEQLKEDIVSFQKDISDDLWGDIQKEFDDIDAGIVMPSLWKK